MLFEPTLSRFEVKMQRQTSPAPVPAFDFDSIRPVGERIGPIHVDTTGLEYMELFDRIIKPCVKARLRPGHRKP